MLSPAKKEEKTGKIMGIQSIDGKTYIKMLSGGAKVLSARAQELNALNVFPVSDGDTGTNMEYTLRGGLAEAGKNGVPERIDEASRLFTRGALLSARGNSGVILSQIFAGIDEVLAGKETADAEALAAAYANGTKKAYAAVQNPTEGTILTVFRESGEFAAKNGGGNAGGFFEAALEEARRSLSRTKELLDVLAEADVVDSGAAGYVCIAEGMLEALCGRLEGGLSPETRAPQNTPVDIDLFTRDSKMEYGYCTEFMLRLTTAKTDPDKFEIQTVLDILNSLGGESVVAYKTGDVVKVHVHTFEPGRILDAVQKYGEFLTVKIENMSLGHNETIAPGKKRAEQKKKYCAVAVVSGGGMAALFKDLGADEVIDGGQTCSPSAEDFLKAFSRCDCEDIIVFPNHKNVLLTAQQAAGLYKNARVHVVESKSFAQGFGALSVLTPGITDVSALAESARRAAEGVADGEITKAVRDAVIDGFDIKKGDYIAVCGGSITACEKTAEDAVMAMLAAGDTDFCEIFTLFAGKAVTDEARARLTERINEAYPGLETKVYVTGQEIYDYYTALE